MKILDILEAYETNHKFNSMIDRNDAYMKTAMVDQIDRKQKLGKGAYSTVTSDTDDHLVNKMSHSMHEYDSFHEFAEWVVNSDAARNNPHFPRIYTVDETPVTKDAYEAGKPAKYRVVDYKIEKLYPSQNLNLEQCLACHESIFNSKINKSNACDELLMNLRDSIYNDNNVISDSWKEALVLLRDFLKETDVLEDLHGGNIMFRLGRHTPIPVINDPVA